MTKIVLFWLLGTHPQEDTVDTFTAAAIIAMLIFGIVGAFVLSISSVKRYATRIRILNKGHTYWMLNIAGDNERRQDLEQEQKRFLERSEEYANSQVKMLRSTASYTSFWTAIILMAGATSGYFFNRDVWSGQELAVSIAGGILLLGYAAYNHLECHPFTSS